MTDSANWIAAGFSGGRLDIWAMRGQRALSHHEATGDALGELDGALRELRRIVPQAERNQVVAAGLKDVPLRSVPAVPLAAPLLRLDPTESRWRIHAVPGLRQDRPAALMRGDETRITGFLRANPGWDGVLCLIGPGTNWVQISAGEAVSFRSFMTWELAGTLMRLSDPGPRAGPVELDREVFTDAVSNGMARPEMLAAGLAGLRASAELDATPTGQTWSKLLGLLVGAELAGARPYWLGQQVVAIGDREAVQPYLSALAAQSVPIFATASGRDMMLEGLICAKDLSGAA